MELLRIFLFLGLIFHKLLWEILKRRDNTTKARPKTSKTLRAQMVAVFKGIVLVFLAVQTLFLDLFPIAREPISLEVIGTLVYGLGLTIAVIGRMQLGGNWADLEDFQILSGQSLVESGIYRYIRHPIYTGDLLLLIGLELALNSWLVLGVSIPFLIVIRQAFAEEVILSRTFPEYVAYCSRTKKFIPFIF